MRDAIAAAVAAGMKVAVGFEDAMRAEPSFLREMAMLVERAEWARPEEIIGHIGLVRGDSRQHPDRLRPLAVFVAARTKLDIDPRRPVVGTAIFTCETGLHLQGLQENPATYEPYPPESVGAERRLLFGAKCGRKALQQRLAGIGRYPDTDRLDHAIAVIRCRSRSLRAPLSDSDLNAALS
ncbi:MAG: hypothetical protein WBN83_11380 [Desulfoprunum sp.]|uniref:homocitrate synthase/isopropylmalate synthase family protein n=1 Tax=Desulfoprunum sp. TaxID=2020866 RepID=UPI00068F0C13